MAKTKDESAGTEVHGLKAAAENERYAPGRWMITKKIDEAWDKKAGSREEIIDIKQMAPGTVPDLYDLASGENENAGNYSVEPAVPGVQIGMVKGGEFEKVGDWGWYDAGHKAARGGSGAGPTRLSDVGAS